MDSIDSKHTWKRFFNFVAKQHKNILAVIAILVLVTIGIFSFQYVFQPTPVATQPTVVSQTPVKEEPVTTKYYSPLTGLPVASVVATHQPVTGVMIENSPQARPQSGIKNSGVVFEAIAEGGITRFLVLYQSEKPQLIGPVRSVRPYYLSWLAAFNASIAHVGGSDDALTEVRSGSYRDLDQFFNSSSYWRSTDRSAPHNVYTSFAKLDALNLKKGYTSSTFTGFSRVDGKAITTPDATNIDVKISSSTFNSSYIYNKSTNSYARSQAGAKHLDRESGQITPSVVVAIYVTESTSNDYKHHENITTLGSGKAVIFQNGTALNATWHKSSNTSQITFADASGQDIPLVRGQTWIVAVPSGYGKVTWK